LQDILLIGSHANDKVILKICLTICCIMQRA